MEFFKNLWKKMMKMLDDIEQQGLASVPPGCQPGMVPDELDSFEGWR